MTKSKNIEKTPVLIAAEQLICKLVAMTTEIMHKRKCELMLLSDSGKRLGMSQCISRFGERLANLCRLTDEIQVITARRKPSDTDGDAEKLFAFFFNRFEWDFLHIDIEAELQTIFGPQFKCKKQEHQEHDYVLLRDLGLSNRSINLFTGIGITLVGQIRKLVVRDLHCFRNCGEFVLTETRNKIAALGVDLDHWNLSR